MAYSGRGGMGGGMGGVMAGGAGAPMGGGGMGRAGVGAGVSSGVAGGGAVLTDGVVLEALLVAAGGRLPVLGLGWPGEVVAFGEVGGVGGAFGHGVMPPRG